ncbi:MAG: ubiquinone biosynthesis regulatory protein kinase UbiB [Pseudomonadales bacterium]
MPRLQRLTKIARIAIRYRLDTFVDAQQLPPGLSTLFAIAPWRVFPTPKQSRGERLRLSLEALGPVFIKFGQMLSTRRDLIPEDIVTELAKLQDQVPPFSSQQAIEIIEGALGKSVDELFANFTTEPIASASVAQIHAATLHSGEDVVVKVIRPSIEKVIRQDIKLLLSITQLIEKYLPDGRRLRPVEVVNDYQHTILDELDLQREGANTSQLRRNFIGSGLLYVPEVHWDFTNRKVLTMERIHGIPVTDMDALTAQNTNMKMLAERGVEIFFTQVFRDSFFHADMHPGNIFVSREHPETPQYIGIDCAIIGTLSDSDQYYLARNLLAIFQRDFRLVAELHVECGWVPPATRVNEFESAIRTVCEPIFEKPLHEISFGQLLIYLFQTARRFEMEVQPSLVLLQKTLLNIEGLGRELYPQLNLWDTAQPFLKQWLKDRYAPKGIYKRISKHLPGWLEQLPQLPEALMDSLQQSKQLHTISKQQQNKIEQLEKQLQAQHSRMNTVSALLLLLAAASPWLLDELHALQGLEKISEISWVLVIVAGLLWLRR